MPYRGTAVVSLVLGVLAAALITWAARAQSTPPPRPDVSSHRDYPVQPVPFTAVHLDDGFWAPRIETNRVETIPFAFKQCELSGRVDNFIRAAKALRGERLENTKPPGYPFDDTDVYKVIEGASYALSVHPDPSLDGYGAPYGGQLPSCRGEQNDGTGRGISDGLGINE